MAEATGSSKPKPTATPPQVGDRSPFLIGSVGVLSGPGGQALKPGVDALQVWAKWTNDRGGINGHPVVLTVADDGGDPARHRALVQELVERRGVIAFVHNSEVFSGKGSVGYHEEKGIPVIGSDTGGEYFNTSPIYFPQAPTGSVLLRSMLAGTANSAGSQGKTKLGILVCTEAQICHDAHQIWPEEAATYGMKSVYAGQVSLAQPDFTAECLTARHAGVEVMMLGLPASAEVRVAASCARQGIKFLYSLVASDPAAMLAEDPNLDGTSVLSFHAFPWMVDSSPATAEFQAVMAKYRPGQAIGGVNALGWVSAKLFEKVASTVTGAPSSQALLEGLWSIKNDNLGGLTAPLTFTRGQPAKTPVCWSEITIKDGRWVSLNSGDVPRCR